MSLIVVVLITNFVAKLCVSSAALHLCCSRSYTCGKPQSIFDIFLIIVLPDSSNLYCNESHESLYSFCNVTRHSDKFAFIIYNQNECLLLVKISKTS